MPFNAFVSVVVVDPGTRAVGNGRTRLGGRFLGYPGPVNSDATCTQGAEKVVLGGDAVVILKGNRQGGGGGGGGSGGSTRGF